ncbi:MAG TPA: SGNH/GDSL hydrolase family protein [Kiritimatiellia bacterium]|nr:SGNH/GDSL hydrolase family protein [Kiritimatiellia bacterium]HRU71332.1 SGNH/GDSL hydrolase family protein [Kiritimatiellia bacterium]
MSTRHLRALGTGCLVLAGLLARCEPDQAFFFKNNDSVVFLGDSITQQKLYTTYLEAYTLTRFPDYRFRFRNVGWGGDTAWLRKRFKTDEKALFAATGALLDEMVEKAVRAGLQRDVLPHKPTAVTVKFGMNDHAYQAFREDICRAYVRSQTEIVNILKAEGARVALLTPQPIQDKPPAEHDKNVKNQSLRKFSDALRDVAAKTGAVYVDQFDPYMKILLAARAADPEAKIGGGDAVHPGPSGHTLMAWTILKQLNAPALVSEGGIDAARWFFRRKVTCEKNCEISNVKVKKGTVSFDRLDHALPMPVDARATEALTLAPVTDDLNSYMLKVEGLDAARYVLTIDGLHVAEFSREELAQGVNLANYPTPNATQAMQVLDLVFKKNDVYFERWRKVQLENGPSAKLVELDNRIAELEAQIDVARKPRPHRFELTPRP